MQLGDLPWPLEFLIRIVRMILFTLYDAVECLIPESFRSKSLNNEIVLITGAGSGIGRLLAFKCAQENCKLVLVDIDKASVDAVAAEINRAGEKRAFSYKCDISARAEVYALADKIRSEVGHVTVLVNNAGIVSGKKLLENSDERMVKTMEVNTIAHFWTVKAFLPRMLENNHGHIVTIASVAGFSGVCGLADYCASKFGAVGFDESLRFEIQKLGKSGVHTTLVCPFYIDTGMFKGVKTRFQLVLPFLKPEYVSAKIYSAIKTNQVKLVMPRFLYLTPIFRILPPKAFDETIKFFRISDSMDEFVGHSKSS